MLATACEPLMNDPQLVASMLQGAMAGVSRRLLESDSPEKQFATLRKELIFFVSVYMEACSARSAAEGNRYCEPTLVGGTASKRLH
jgi:hypothetical protein